MKYFSNIKSYLVKYFKQALLIGFKFINKLIFWNSKIILTICLRGKSLIEYINCFALIIVGFILIFISSVTPLAKNIAASQNLDGLFLACGGLIGTMIALIVSLSIIPIQKSVESFTTSVTHLYSKDKVIQFIFVSLSVLCLSSFLMSVDGLSGLSTKNQLYFQILILMCSFDLLRWHQRYISRMLMPQEAIKKITQRIMKWLNITRQIISSLAFIQWNLYRPKDKENNSRENIENALYKLSASYRAPVINYLNELAETANKAIQRNEAYSSRLAVSSLTDIGCYYMDMRKDNLNIYFKSIWGVYGSDIEDVLEPIYERLSEINQKAINANDELLCKNIIQGFGKLALHTATLKAPSFTERPSPITWLPLGYLVDCASKAQAKGYIDVPLEACRSLRQIALNANNQLLINNVINKICKISLTFFVSKNTTLVNEIIKEIMTINFFLLQQRSPSLDRVTENILLQYKTLMPFAVIFFPFGQLNPEPPLSAPYSLCEPLSIGNMVTKALDLIEPDKKRGWIDPYSKFISFNKTIQRHFRDMADNVDFKSSFMLHFVTETIKHILLVYLEVLKSPLKTSNNNIYDNKEIESQAIWYLSFFWACFKKMSIVDANVTERTSDAIARIGIEYFFYGHVKVSLSCAENIKSIVNEYCKKTSQLNYYDVADSMMPIWYMRLLAEAKENEYFVNKCDEAMNKPEGLTEDDWNKVQSIFILRKQQLQDELSQYDDFRIMDDARAILKSTLMDIN